MKIKFLLLICILSSCTMTPKYHRPKLNMPDEYRLSLNENEELTCEPLIRAANIEWWEELNDLVLNRLITDALANNNDLKFAIARVDEYYGIVGVVSSLLYPQVDGEFYKARQQYSLNAVPNPITGSPSLQRFNTYSTLFNAAYEIDIWGKIQSRSDAAYTDYLRQIEVRRTVVLTLVAEVANAYIELRRLDKQMKISIKTLKSREEAERIARARFEEGLTSELPLKQAQSETEAAIIAIKVLEIQIPQQENLISVLIGQPPGAIARGETLDTLTMPEKIPVGVPAQLITQRPDILAAEDILIATNFDIGAARAAFLPTISLSGFYGNQSTHAFNLMSGNSVTWSTFINIFQPIFTGGRLISELAIAKARNQEALFNYYNIVLNALKEVNDALIAHKKNLELVVEQKAQVEIFQKYRYLAELQYNNGESDYLNVLDAERRLFESQLLLATREANSFTSLVNLYKALGGGWVIDADNFNSMVSQDEPCQS